MRDLNDINSEITLEQQVKIFDAPISQSRLQWSALLEIAVFLIVFFLIDHFFLDGTRFRQIEPHPFWIMVLLVSAQYGTRMGVVSAVAASVMFVFGNMPEQLLEQNMHEWFFSVFKLPILWFIASVIIGEISVRRIGMRRRLNQQLAEHVRREATLLKSFDQMNFMKEKLEVRFAGQSRTVRKTLRAARDMENLEQMQVLRKAKVLVASMLEPEKFSIYILKDNQLELLFEQGWQVEDSFLRHFTAENPLYKSVTVDWKILNIANADDEIILGQQGVLAGPLIMPETGKVFGMLKIEKHDFSYLSLNTIKDFNSICQWIGLIYGRSIEKK